MYAKQTWIDGDTVNTPLNAARLTVIENGLAKAGQYLGSFNGSFPAINVQAGDTVLRTDVGTNGSLWIYTGVAGLGSGGWVHKGLIVCTSTTRPTTVAYAGLNIFETDTKLEVIFDGAAWFWTQRTTAPKLQTGQVVWSLTPGQTGQVQTITFATPFTNVPNVVLAMGGSANDYHWITYAEGATNTSFTARINSSSATGAPVTGALNGYWIAVGT